MRSKKLWAAALLSAATGAAMAEGYLAVAGGLATIPLGSCVSGASCDERSFGARVQGGLIVHPNVALEANFLHFGEATIKASIVRAEVTAYAVTGGVALRLPIDPALGGVLRLGVAQSTVEQTSNFGFEDSGTSSHFYWGLGAEFALNKNVSMTVGYDRTSGETDGGDSGSLSLFSAGLKFQF
jgi:OmpA-OmpF porin, OOP family